MRIFLFSPGPGVTGQKSCTGNNALARDRRLIIRCFVLGVYKRNNFFRRINHVKVKALLIPPLRIPGGVGVRKSQHHGKPIKKPLSAAAAKLRRKIHARNFGAVLLRGLFNRRYGSDIVGP